MENLTADERRLVLPMMKNYIEKYKIYTRRRFREVRGDLQDFLGETQGPVSRVESIFIIISIAFLKGLEVYKIDITSAYLNTPMTT